MRTIIFALLFFGSMLASAKDLTLSEKSCRCDTKIEDPFERPIKFNFGKYTGKCVNTCKFRAVEILPNAKAAIKNLKSNDIVIGNFHHINKYYIAVIPANSVQSVEMGFEEFQPFINHIFTRFQLDPKAPARLYEQVGERKYVGTVSTVVISSEGVPPEKMSYSLLESFMENYLLVDLVLSEDQVREANKTYKHAIKYYSLDISRAHGNEILKNGLIRSHSQQFGQVYKLFSQNCATSALDLLNSMAKAKASSYLKIVEDSLPIEAPVGILQSLRERRLLKSEAPQLLENTLK